MKVKKECSLEASAVVQVRNDAGLDHRSSSQGDGSGPILNLLI